MKCQGNCDNCSERSTDICLHSENSSKDFSGSKLKLCSKRFKKKKYNPILKLLKFNNCNIRKLLEYVQRYQLIL